MKLPSERVAVLGVMDPQTMANSEKTTDWCSLKIFGGFMAILALGDMAAETIDFKLEQATDASGTGKKDLVAATQLAAHASNNDNKQLVLECLDEDLDSDNGFCFVRGRGITGNTTGGPACIIGLGLDPKYGPAKDNDLASVAEIARAS